MSPFVRRASAVAFVAALLLAGCQAPGPMTITRVVYSQDQAIEGFDDSEASTEDPEQTAALADLLAEHGLSGNIELGEDCPGGRSTEVHYTTASGTFHIDVAGCDSGEAGAAIEGLISSWRT